ETGGARRGGRPCAQAGRVAPRAAAAEPAAHPATRPQAARPVMRAGRAGVAVVAASALAALAVLALAQPAAADDARWTLQLEGGAEDDSNIHRLEVREG